MSYKVAIGVKCSVFPAPKYFPMKIEKSGKFKPDCCEVCQKVKR